MINLWINSLGQEWDFFCWVCMALQSHLPALHRSSYFYCSSSSLMKELSALNNLQVIEVIPYSQNATWEMGGEGTVTGAVSRTAGQPPPSAALPREGRALQLGGQCPGLGYVCWFEKSFQSVLSLFPAHLTSSLINMVVLFLLWNKCL